MRNPLWINSALALAFVVAAGCGSTEDPAPNEQPPANCLDATIQELGLIEAPSTRAITNTADVSDWISVIDATAGGMTVSESYVYASFTDSGLVPVSPSLGDWQALESSAWDIAFRRFVIRLNSGDSGPSTTMAVLMPTDTVYDALTAPPADAPYQADDFMTAPPACELIPDSHGLATAPNTYLSGYWEYPSCVAMTGAVYVLSLASGRHVKLTVEAYYSDVAMADCCQLQLTPECQAVTPAPACSCMTFMGSAHPRVRWSFLD